jgi:ribosomal protein S18 acetylase RimI-like enzyme
MYELRYATRFDIDRVKALLDSAKDIFGFIPRPAIWGSIAKGELIVATPYINSQDIVGFCRFHKRRDSVTTIYELYVKQEHRKRGIGKRMVSRLKGRLRAKCPAEYESNGFYEKLSFSMTGIENGKRKNLNIWERIDEI